MAKQLCIRKPPTVVKKWNLILLEKFKKPESEHISKQSQLKENRSRIFV